MAYKTMNELMADYRAHAAANRWIEAHDVLVYMVQCGNLRAKLELARLYKDSIHLGLQQERYRKAEFYYHSILNLPDLSNEDMARISLEVAELYTTYMKRPIGGLAMLLRGKRLGAHVPDREVDHVRQLLMNLDVNDFCKFSRDAYVLGIELSLAGGGARMIEFLLRAACESSDELIRGKASLALADFYNDRRNENYIYAGEATRCYRQALEAGFPEYLSRHNRV